MAEGFLTPAEVAELLRLRVQTVYEYIRLGRLPAVRLRKGYRISREDLAEFLEASKTAKRDTRAVARLELGERKAPGDEQGG
jgi:excisionase family DNA binding protein